MHDPAAVSPALVFTPERLWHWPDRADPDTLASWVRETIATMDSCGMPSDAA